MGNTIKKIINIRKECNNYSFEILFILCLTFIISFSMYRKYKGEKGSWSTNYFYDESMFNPNKIEIEKPINKINSRPDSKGEVECRRVLEQIFKKPFKKSRPNFLNNPVTGGKFNLELDCYNENLKIAVEYDGAAHAKYIPFFHKNKEAFYNQKYRDYIKDRICKENGILLIRVPHTVKLENIERFIKDNLRNKLRF